MDFFEHKPDQKDMALNTNALLRKPYMDPIWMQKSLQRAGIPRKLRDRVVVSTKSILAPGEVAKRTNAAAALPKPMCTDIEQFKRQGSGILDASALPSAVSASKEIQKYYDRLDQLGRVKRPDGHRKAEFLVRLAGDDEILSIAEAREFVLSGELLSLASHYFGEVPLLSRVDLWWSPPNESKAESQLYHYDGEDKSQLKVILNVRDVDQATGPFTFVDAESSSRVAGTRRHSARLDDDLVESLVGADAVTQVIGRSGSVAAVDTSRCLHYGSRENKKPRLILMLQFTRFLAPKASLPNWAQLLETSVVRELDPPHKMLLNLA